MKTYMTVLTNNKYIPGVMALQRSLSDVNSRYPLTILVPENKEDTLSRQMDHYGIKTKNSVISKPAIDVEIPVVEKEYAYWKDTFFKLVAVSCVEFEKIVLLDADMLIQHNIDELFEKPNMSGVVAGKCFRHDWINLNSGMLVIEPSEDAYQKMLANIQPAIDSRRSEGLSAGDQDVFHSAYPDWYSCKELILPETYNCLWGYINAVCTVENRKPLDIKIIHFIGKKKPWEFERSHWIRQIASWIKHADRKHLITRAKIWQKYWKYAQKR